MKLWIEEGKGKSEEEMNKSSQTRLNKTHLSINQLQTPRKKSYRVTLDAFTHRSSKTFNEIAFSCRNENPISKSMGSSNSERKK